MQVDAVVVRGTTHCDTMLSVPICARNLAGHVLCVTVESIDVAEGADRVPCSVVKCAFKRELERRLALEVETKLGLHSASDGSIAYLTGAADHECAGAPAHDMSSLEGHHGICIYLLKVRSTPYPDVFEEVYYTKDEAIVNSSCILPRAQLVAAFHEA